MSLILTTEQILERLSLVTSPDFCLDLSIYMWLSGGDLNELGPESPPRYTESIEGAMNLLPPNCIIHSIHGGKAAGFKQLWTVTVCLNNNHMIAQEAEHEAQTPAIAICMAAVRAWEYEITKAKDSVS